MKTSDYIIYAALIYLFFKVTKKPVCNCNSTATPVGAGILQTIPDNLPKILSPVLTKALDLIECQNCPVSLPLGIQKIIDLPMFAKVDPQTIDQAQIIPTPASVLSPEQLVLYNASLQGVNRKPSYIC
jgi:hypothetical protein